MVRKKHGSRKKENTRRKKRIKIKYPITIFYNNKEIRGNTIDVNEAGIRVLLDDHIPDLMPLKINIRLTPKKTITSEINLMWRDPLSNTCGVAFQNLTEKDKKLFKNIINISDKNKFSFSKTVYLGDTNAEGNVYFAKYFEWQGQAREEFYKQNFPLSIWQSGIRLITISASTNYKQSAYLFEIIAIHVGISNVKKMSVGLFFNTINKNTGQTIAEGRQKIAFADQKGRLIPVPEEIRNRLASFVIT